MDARSGITILRVVIAALGAALGVYLLMGGRVVLGGLVLAIAVARCVLVAMVWRRGRRFRSRFVAGDAPRPTLGS
jgi:hypothetical protein